MDSRDRFYGFSLLFNIFAEKKTYYAGIMLDAPSIVLCSKLCRHNVSDPNDSKVYHIELRQHNYGSQNTKNGISKKITHGLKQHNYRKQNTDNGIR